MLVAAYVRFCVPFGSVVGVSVMLGQVGEVRVFERAEAARMLHAILDSMDEEKREVFVLSELEQLSIPDAAEALSVNVNTAYARLRAAKQIFESAVSRLRARDARRES